MSGTNGHGGPGAGAAVTAARPVVLVRSRPSVTGENARTVHVVSLPTHRAGAVSTLCGAVLMLADIETVTPGDSMPCTVCVINHVAATAPTGEPPAGSADAAGLTAGEIAYQEWGWPVTRHRDQVRLSLHRDVSALVIPIPLSTEIREILTQRRCAPPVLAHPYTPDHHIMLFGERYGVTLPWPSQVHQVTGTLLLPPTVTPRGPITWSQPPRENSLRLCREIDLFGALRTVLNDLNNHR
ncbi:MAG: hypothetical protein ACRDSZ_18670 [Pseudonocardiaceae bacterium]